MPWPIRQDYDAVEKELCTYRLECPDPVSVAPWIILTKKKLTIMTSLDMSPHSPEEHAVQSGSKANGSKDGALGVVEVMDIEEGETQKGFYSKGSVVMMVIFSGLAIGSDG